MFKHLALTNNGLASTLFEPWSQYMHKQGVYSGNKVGFAGSVCFGLLVVLLWGFVLSPCLFFF